MYDEILNIHYALAPAIIAGIIAAGATLFQTKMQNDANRENQRLQNEYNTPAMQMARYRSAGLNPALIYSQGTPGNQAAPVQSNAPELGKMGDYVQLMLADKQMQLTDANIRKTNADANFSESNALEKMRDVNSKIFFEDKAGAKGDYYHVMSQYSADAKRLELDRIIGDIALKRANELRGYGDIRLKEDVHKEKEYYNYQRQFGLEKTDPWWFRSGTAIPRSINQHLRR